MGIFDVGSPLGMALASLMGSPSPSGGGQNMPPAQGLDLPPNQPTRGILESRYQSPPPADYSGYYGEPALESRYQSPPPADNSGYYAQPPMARSNSGQDLASAVAPPQGDDVAPSMRPAVPPGQVPLPIPRGSFGPTRPDDMGAVPQNAPPLPPPTQVAGPGGGGPQPPMPTGPPPPMPGGGMPSPGVPQGAPPAGPWLSGIFGSDPRRTAQIAGSLGAGLKSVGQNWNRPGLAAFAGSAGAAIEGGTAGDERQTKDEREAKQEALRNQQFRETQLHNDQQYQTAQRRLDIAQQVGTVRSRADAWRNSDLGKLSMADQEIRLRHEGVRKSMEADLKDGSLKKRQDAQKRLDDEFKRIQGEVYKSRGIDPNKIDDLKKLGTSYKTPFEPKTVDEFHEFVKPPRPDPNNPGQMLPGDFYRNPRNGRVYRRDSEAPPPADAPGGVLSTPDPNSIGGGFDQPQQQ